MKADWSLINCLPPDTEELIKKSYLKEVYKMMPQIRKLVILQV